MNDGARDAHGSPLLPTPCVRRAASSPVSARGDRRPPTAQGASASPSALPPARRPAAATCFQLRYRRHRPTATALTRIRQTAAACRTLRRRRGQRRAPAVPASQRPPTNRAARRAVSDVRGETECWGALSEALPPRQLRARRSEGGALLHGERLPAAGGALCCRDVRRQGQTGINSTRCTRVRGITLRYFVRASGG